MAKYLDWDSLSRWDKLAWAVGASGMVLMVILLATGVLGRVPEPSKATITVTGSSAPMVDQRFDSVTENGITTYTVSP